MLPPSHFPRQFGRLLQTNKATGHCAPILHAHRIALGFSTLAPEAPHPKSTPTNLNAQNTVTSRTQQVARHFSSAAQNTIAMSSLPVSEKGYHANAPGGYTVRKNGAPNTLEHRVYIEKDGVPVSAFHDVPLYANEQQTILNMIVEIPRWTNAKMEVSF